MPASLPAANPQRELPDHRSQQDRPNHAPSAGSLEAVRSSFDQATEAIGRRCGQVVGKRQVEQLTVAAAADIDVFYRAVVPQPCTDATVLVLSVDGKGVVMRPEALREATLKAAEAKGPGP